MIDFDIKQIIIHVTLIIVDVCKSVSFLMQTLPSNNIANLPQ